MSNYCNSAIHLSTPDAPTSAIPYDCLVIDLDTQYTDGLMTPFLDPTQNSTPDNIYLHSVTPSLPSLYSEEESFLVATNIAYNIQLCLIV